LQYNNFLKSTLNLGGSMEKEKRNKK
jgi:hypothetical protein